MSYLLAKATVKRVLIDSRVALASRGISCFPHKSRQAKDEKFIPPTSCSVIMSDVKDSKGKASSSREKNYTHHFFLCASSRSPTTAKDFED